MAFITQGLRSYTGCFEVPLSLKAAVAAVSVADAAFQYFSEDVEFFKSASKAQTVFSLTRSAALTLSVWSLSRGIPSAVLGLVAYCGLSLHYCFIRISIEGRIWEFSWEKPLNHRVSEGILALQQVTYVALAIFSKSHAGFGALSAINLYTLWKMTNRDWLSMKETVEKKAHGKDVRFEYKATFLVSNRAEKEINRQRDIFQKAVRDFQLVNRVKKVRDTYEVYVEKGLKLSSREGFEQVMHDGLVIEVKGSDGKWHIPKVNECSYQGGQKIQVSISQFKPGENQTAFGYLEDGTVVCFPDVQWDVPEKLMNTVIEAIVLSKEIKNGTIHLECVSEALPKQERIVVGHIAKQNNVWVKFQYEMLPLPKEGMCCCGSEKVYSVDTNSELVACKACLTQSMEESVKKIELINRPGRSSCYALKEMLPQGEKSRLSVWINADKSGWWPAAIHGLQYAPKQKLRVQIKQFEMEENRTAYGRLDDGTTVCIPRVFSERALEIIRAAKSITVEVISKEIRNGNLYLICSSEAFIPQTKTLLISQLWNGVQFDYKAVFRPKLLQGDERNEACPICLEEPEQAYYTCFSGHTQCEACLKDIFQRTVSEFTYVNQPRMMMHPLTFIPLIQFYAQKDMLPICPICRGDVGSEKQLSILTPVSDRISTELVWLNYQIGQKMEVRINRFEPQLSAAEAMLEDGTLLECLHVQPAAVTRLLQTGEPIQVEIKSKTVQNGTLYLICSSEDLPESDYFLNQERTFTIEAIDDRGTPYTLLSTGERAYFHGKASVGTEVTAYFWTQEVREGYVALDYSPYRLGQKIEFCVTGFTREGLTVGILNNGQRLLFPNLCILWEMVTGYVQSGAWNDGEFLLVCSPEELSI
jgi:hypothetical protein